MATPPKPSLRSLLHSAAPSESHHALTTSLIPSLLTAISQIATTLQQSHHVSLAGSANAFGDDQLDVDVAAENIIRDALSRCASAVTASSEEDPVERTIQHAESLTDGGESSERYSVAFDPLDGSSIIAPNWTVGTIIGIWEGESALGLNPRERQVASILGVFGPRTTAVVAVRVPGGEPLCFEVGLSGNDSEDYQVIRESVRLSSQPYKTRYFAPANLRAASEDEAYMGLVTRYITDRYTLRYSGGLVPDVVHALVKGHGIYLSPVTPSCPAKLRRLFELCPIAMILECAGGKAIDSATGEDVLSRAVLNCDERGGLVCGNGEDVDAVRAVLVRGSV